MILKIDYTADIQSYFVIQTHFSIRDLKGNELYMSDGYFRVSGEINKMTDIVREEPRKCK